MSLLQFIEKNWMLVATLVASGAMLVWPFIGRRFSGGHEIGTLGVTRLINTQNPLLLDVRETKEMEGGKLPNAVHVPLSQLASRGSELTKHVARPVIAYCDRGQRGRARATARVESTLYPFAGEARWSIPPARPRLRATAARSCNSRSKRSTSRICRSRTPAPRNRSR